MSQGPFSGIFDPTHTPKSGVFDGIFRPGGGPVEPRNTGVFGDIFRQPPISNRTGGPISSGGAQASPSPASSGGSDAISRYYEMMMSQMPSRGQQSMADLSSILGGFSSGEKANRIVEGNFTGDFDRMMLDRERDQNLIGIQAAENRRADESDAIRKLGITGYLSRGGSDFKMPTFNLSGEQRTPVSFGIGPKPASEAQVAGAKTLEQQLLKRLEPNGSFQPQWNYQPHPLESYATPGLAENIGSYGGAIVGGLGALDQFLGNGGIVNRIAGMLGGGGGSLPFDVAANSAQGIRSIAGMGLPGGAAGAGSRLASIMGKAAPIAGAITGGIGLLRDRGIGQNVMNGVTTGASIGSIVPGLGTAVGAGIGGLVGALRGVNWGGGPSEEEKAGRGLAGNVRNSLTSGATPEQRAEAAASGQGGQALMHIMLRDRFGEQAAGQLTKQLFEAEKQGPEAVAQVMNQFGSSIRG